MLQQEHCIMGKASWDNWTEEQQKAYAPDWSEDWSEERKKAWADDRKKRIAAEILALQVSKLTMK